MQAPPQELLLRMRGTSVEILRIFQDSFIELAELGNKREIRMTLVSQRNIPEALHQKIN